MFSTKWYVRCEITCIVIPAYESIGPQEGHPRCASRRDASSPPPKPDLRFTPTRRACFEKAARLRQGIGQAGEGASTAAGLVKDHDGVRCVSKRYCIFRNERSPFAWLWTKGKMFCRGNPILKEMCKYCTFLQH